ncbi:PAS domain-containing sensor histidine kinase [Ferruginibacter sp.]|nr:PAS domain S-box protein [Ferruginibacter sp.]
MNQFQDFFKNNTAIMLLIDIDNGNITDANTTAVEFYKYDYKKLCSLNIADINILSKNEIQKQINGLHNSSIIRPYYKHKIADNTIRDIQVFATPVQDKGQRYNLAIIQDVTEQKTAEISLKESEANLKAAEQLGKFGHFEFDLTSQMFNFSEGGVNLYGLDSNLVPATLIKEMRCTEYDKLMDEVIANLKKDEYPSEIEYKIKRLVDDKLIGIRIISQYSKERNIVFGSVQDVTERMNATEALKQSEEKFKHLISEMTVGIVVHASNAEINLYNSKAIELLGISGNQLLGKSPFSRDWNVIHEDGSNFPAKNHPATEAIVKGEVVRDVVMGVYRPLKKDRVWLLVTAIPEIKNGLVHQVVVTFYDITEKRIKDEKIIQLNNELKELSTHLQRLREVERNKLAVEVHDKLGQKLIGVKFQINILKSKLKEYKPDLSEIITPIAEEVAFMVKDFGIIYNKVNPSFIEDLELFDMIENLIYTYRKQTKIKIDFSSNVQNEKLPSNFKRVIYNTVNECLNNLVAHSKAKNAIVKLFKINGTLSLIVQDDGIGFNISGLDYKKQIGLIEMRENIQSIGGVIDFESVLERGTIIKVNIPQTS